MPGYTIDMIDVGQGDAFVVASDEASCLIDSGSAARGGDAVVRHVQDHFDGQLDYALLTHVDDDHIAGFQRVLKSGIRFQRVFFNDPMAAFTEVLRKSLEGYTSRLTKQAAVAELVKDIRKIDELDEGKTLLASVQTESRIKKLLADAGIPNASAFAGRKIPLGVTTELRVLSPRKEDYPGFVAHFSPRNRQQLHDLLEKAAAESAENSSSTVVEVRCSDAPADIALLTADAGPGVLKAIANKKYKFVKIPHHGAESTFDEDLLDVWSPNVVALSHGSRYGHPSALWMDAMKSRGIDIGCSNCQGTIRFWRAGAKSVAGDGWVPLKSDCRCGA